MNVNLTVKVLFWALFAWSTGMAAAFMIQFLGSPNLVAIIGVVYSVCVGMTIGFIAEFFDNHKKSYDAFAGEVENLRKQLADSKYSTSSNGTLMTSKAAANTTSANTNVATASSQNPVPKTRKKKGA